MSPYPKARGLYLDLGYNSLKVLLHGRGLEIPLERSPGGKYDTESKETVTRQLQGFLGSSRGVRRAVCAVPARGVSLRSLTIPRASREETRKLLALQVEKEFPLPPEEIAWGYVAEDEAPGAGNGARKDAGSLQEVAILAVRRRLLAEYAALLEGCGVRATFQLGALATSAVCPAAGGNGSVLDIGRTHSELLVLEDGKARLLRSFSWGGESVTQAIGEALKIGRDEAEELKRAWKVSADEKAGSGPVLSAAIATAVNDLLRLLQEAWPPRSSGNGARPPSMLFLAGGGSQLPGLDEKVARSLGEGVTCKVLKLERAPGLSSATLGLALDEGRASGTLSLSLEKRGEKSLNGKARSGRGWLLLAGFLAVQALGLRYGPPLWRLADLKARIVTAQKLRDAFPRIDTELAFLEYLDESQLPCLEALSLIAKAAPQGTSLTAVSMSRQGEVSLQGRVPGFQEANDFRSRLTLSGRFQAAVLQEETPDKDKKFVDIRIRAQLQPAGAAVQPSPAQPSPAQPSPAQPPPAQPPAAQPPAGPPLESGPPPERK